MTDNPFVPPVDERDPARRFRGRLAAPVTIVTSGPASDRAGLTISSLFVVEGEPARVHLVVGPVSDLWDRMAETGLCVVHIAGERHRAMADVFAGLRPNPGGPFAGTAVDDSEWGPVLGELADRAFCRVVDQSEEGWSGVVVAEVDRIELGDDPTPVVHHRGRYRRLGDQV